MKKLTTYQLKRLENLTKDIPDANEVAQAIAWKEKYKSMTLAELEAAYQLKMDEPTPPIIINGKDINLMNYDELTVVYADCMRDRL